MTGPIRKYVETHIPLSNLSRDERISQEGQEVSVIYPTSISSNIYGDRSVDSTRQIVKVPMVFDWKGYNLLLSFADSSNEETIPLYAMSRVIDDIPVGTLVTIDNFSPDGVSEDIKVFRVVKIGALHERLQHGRKLTMVVNRGIKFR
jgi:hypothetical protein